MNAMITVPIRATPHPALANASGIARMPEPSDAFSRFARDLISLKYKRNVAVIS